MKKIYMLFAAMAFVGLGVLNAQLLIDETFDDWDPTDQAGFISGSYSDWNYTTPKESAFELRNCRYKPGDDYVDLERDDKGGAIILPEIPNCSKVELDIRSGNNSSVTGDRYFYISTYDGSETFTQISPDIPAIGRNILKDPDAAEFIDTEALFATYSNTEEVVSSDPIRFAILNKTGNAGGNVRLEGLRVWGGDGSVGIINNSAEAQIVIYTTPKNIKIGGDVVNVEVINLAGSVIKTSNIKGIQSISTSDLNNGVYIVKATDSKGITKTEKVIIR